jgi:hypothetical protein
MHVMRIKTLSMHVNQLSAIAPPAANRKWPLQNRCCASQQIERESTDCIEILVLAISQPEVLLQLARAPSSMYQN